MLAYGVSYIRFEGGNEYTNEMRRR
jgi:hypothetical protein